MNVDSEEFISKIAISYDDIKNINNKLLNNTEIHDAEEYEKEIDKTFRNSIYDSTNNIRLYIKDILRYVNIFKIKDYSIKREGFLQCEDINDCIVKVMVEFYNVFFEINKAVKAIDNYLNWLKHLNKSNEPNEYGEYNKYEKRIINENMYYALSNLNNIYNIIYKYYNGAYEIIKNTNVLDYYKVNLKRLQDAIIHENKKNKKNVKHIEIRKEGYKEILEQNKEIEEYKKSINDAFKKTGMNPPRSYII